MKSIKITKDMIGEAKPVFLKATRQHDIGMQAED
jgi:hypothetical protein